ncbi:hydrogenase expression/formation protein HypE [Actinopolyspora alba]|uniref:Hydrogenase expression/formation protein HypE n=1 Tax=Actinopolyspora alba TaxID=673379 RepID=A0A1I1YMY6_9ACTN|nr:hydrogenase expression/formation protein HypE [Actinopolyspora alba]SFE19513.1 hydrogenase expression/formation protein HypE [Actinopolyspora alba]
MSIENETDEEPVAATGTSPEHPTAESDHSAAETVHSAAEPAHGVAEPGSDYRSREQQVLDRIEKARARKPKIKEERVTSAHGAGGKASQTLTEALFLEELRNPHLEKLEDGAEFAVDDSRLAMTTDSFVVSPLFFPGGDIGELAVNGTVNDLAVSGATPLYLSAGFIIEEGFPISELRRVVRSMAEAAERAGVRVVTGDTKVVQKGKADGCYINTTGVGVRRTEHELGIDTVRPGDAVLVSGPVGDHGVTVMLERGELDIDADLESDTAPLHDMVAGLLESTPGVRAMRDATRGGVATILNEVATAANVAVVVEEGEVPVRTEVRGASELLGIDPLYVACEGRMVAIVDGESVDTALAAMREHPHGSDAAVIGRIGEDPPGLVMLNTAFGGTRIVDLLVGDPLPRIC